MNGFSTFEFEAINPHEAIEGLRNFKLCSNIIQHF